MNFALARLLREWAAVIAVLAIALGPLAGGVSRSLVAQERVNVAAGLIPLPICQPGDAADGLATAIAICDHCLQALAAPPPAPAALASPCRFAGSRFPADTAPFALLSHLRLPPATGPPAA